MAKTKRKASSGEMKDQDQEPSNEKPQKYDETFKKWITQQVNEILPILVTGVKYERELSVEFSRSMIRADKVFRVSYHGKRYILNIEFQVGEDEHLPSRLLLYNAALYHQYHLPVMSMVIYPFFVEMAVPPLVIPNSEKDILTFHFETMPLFEMNAEPYVQNQQTCMYPLLPAMLGFHADMAVQAMSELSERYRDDHGTLAEQFIWMQLCLDRTKTIKLPEKINIRGRLSMFDQLWEESPTIQKMRAQYYEKGEVQGFEKGEVQTLRRTLVEFVQIRFPELTELAQRQAQLCQKPEVLETITRELFKAPESGTAQQLLESMSE